MLLYGITKEEICSFFYTNYALSEQVKKKI